MEFPADSLMQSLPNFRFRLSSKATRNSSFFVCDCYGNWLGLQGLKQKNMDSKIKFLPSHNAKQAIADIVDSEGGFKFRDHVTKEERSNILNWLEAQGVKVVVK